MYHRSKGLSFEAALRDISASKPRDRVAAAEALGRAEGADARAQAFEALASAIGDSRPEVRTTACFSLAEIEMQEAWEMIALCLSDAIPEVRQSAAISLGSLRAPGSFSALLEALQDGPPDLRFQAATSLVEVDASAAYEPLLQALDDSDPEVLGAVALSLGAIGNASCADQLAQLLDHPSKQTRLDAAYALAQLSDPRASETLAAALADKDGGWDAAIALEELGPRSVAALSQFLDGRQGEARVRLRAAGAVLTLGGDEGSARRCLLEGLRSRKMELLGLAVQQLETSGRTWAIAPLQALLPSWRARRLRDEIQGAIETIQSRTASDRSTEQEN